MKENKQKTCCICGTKFKGWGNNPYPVNDKPEARCCDKCDRNVVIPMRIVMMRVH